MRKLLCISVVFLILAVGCSTPPESHDVESSFGGEAPPTRSKHDVEQSLIHRATKGLAFSDGLVDVERPLPRDPAAARLAHAQADDLLLGANRSLEALARYAEAIRLDPLEPLGYAGLGRALMQLREYDTAEAAVRTAVNLDTGSVPARALLADLLERTGRAALAVDEWRWLAEKEPSDGAIRKRLARAYSAIGEPEQALVEASRAGLLGHPLPSHFRRLLENRAAGRAVPQERLATRAGERSGDPIVGPAVRVDPGTGRSPSNEPSSTAVPGGGGGDTVVATFNDQSSGGGLGVSISTDGGATWSDSVIPSPPGHGSFSEGDPMTAYDPRTGNLWVGAIAFDFGTGGLFVARKEPTDDAFRPSVYAGQEFFADKGWMAAGPVFGNPDQTALYIAYNEGVRRSIDLGESWQFSSPLPNGFGRLPRVGPGGELYVSYFDTDHVLVRSFDNGNTFGPEITIAEQMQTIDDDDFPGAARVLAYGSLAVDPIDGELFLVYPDVTDVDGPRTNVDLYFVRSPDGGETWSSPVVLNGDGQPTGDQFFPWLEADAHGRLHLIFYDSRNVSQPDAQEDGFLDAYYAYSDDDGDSWVEIRLTATSFNTKDSFDASLQFIGDYLGVAIADGNAYPTYHSTENGFSEIYVHAITRTGLPELTLSEPVPGLADADNRFTLTGATPGAEIHYLFGIPDGATGVPGCTGLELGIRDARVMGTAIADPSGTAELTTPIPPAAAGRAPGFQAVERSACRASDRVVFSFPELSGTAR